MQPVCRSPGRDGHRIPGSTAYVCVSPDTVEESRQAPERLAEGGSVEVSFEAQFWGDYFGSCEDRFGIKWMVVIANPDAEAPTT